jgi:hypothetical protein
VDPVEVGCHLQEGVPPVAWRKRNLSRKIWTQVNCGPWQDLGAAGMRMNCCIDVEQCKKRGNQKQLKNKTRLWKDAEGNNGMMRKDVKEPLHLRKWKKVANRIGGWSRKHLRLKSTGKGNEIYRKTFKLEAVK